MIAAISWVPKGASKYVPEVAEPPSKEEIEEILKSDVPDVDDAVENDDDDDDVDADVDADVDDNNDDERMSNQDEDIAHALVAADALGRGSKSKNTDPDHITEALEKLDMDNYDEEDDDVDLFGAGLHNLYYTSNEMDPYLKDQDDDDSEDLDDMTIKPEDAVIVCARNEDDVSHLEVWILEDSESDSNMYVHHDIIIPDFPLCLAWLDCPIKGGEKGNFMAVGSMDPAIEIWDLDIMDEVQPSAVLGGIVDKKKKKKRKNGKKKSIKYKDGSHTDAVLSLAWNKEYRNVLASGSADKLVKIWDAATEKCSVTMEHHSDKVQAVAWNHSAPHVLLSGSFDDSVVLKDLREPSRTGLKWAVAADVESLAWDPHTGHSFVVSLENGMVTGFDIRASSSNKSSELQPSFTLHAHDKAVSTISYNPSVANLLATGSTDKTVKLWDLSNNHPSCIASKNPKAGAVFSVSFSNDCPSLLAMAGSKGKLELWDMFSDDAVSARYKSFQQNGKC